ncbi:MAG: ABC transporter ATP-binding protein [Candidatus Eremiobacteraeota bacterium]|nr:ABC transporter ATP-binding protein [Candidatus Eremiobacteraeota bacterium]
MNDAIAVRDLFKRYGNVTALNGITFSVASGTIFGLLGRNGAGKTTALESCIGLVRPTSGSVRVLGLDPARSKDLGRLRGRFGVQLQTTSLPEKATAREILDLYAVYYGLKPAADAMAARVGLEGRVDRFVGVMSGGEKQRLALALALQHDPDVLFLDEPSAGMDAYGRRVLWTEVERLKRAGKTIVLTTHYIEEADRLCDDVCVIQYGRIVARDTPVRLVERFGGDASISFDAEGFHLDSSLSSAGVWTHEESHWSVVTRKEPGQMLAAIVTHANRSGASISSLDLHRPGLEDAFLAITGERIEETVPEAAA